MKFTGLQFSLVGLVLALASYSAYSFNISGNKWPGAATHIHIGIPGTAASGQSWREALRRAAQEWSDKTPFNFTIISSYRDPCIGYRANSGGSGFPSGGGDSLNGADFATTVCGNQFGSNVLAVTLTYTENNQLGAGDIVEADIVFNQNSRFDIYDGPATQSTTGTDFTRVALHELGHVIGMGHEQSARAIMRDTIGNLFTLQEDDIAGATRLYTGYSNCPVRTLNFGRLRNALSAEDCSVQQLMGGGSDTSKVDVYELELLQTTRVTIAMESATLDSVLVLMDDRSRVIQIKDDGGAGCDASITRTLVAGTYAVLANTLTDSSPCGDTRGPYQLSLSYDSTHPLGVGRKTSFQGGVSTAVFAGGVTTDGGRTYSNRVRSTQRFDVLGRIAMDPAHVGRQGFFVVAAQLEDGQIFIRNPVGEFVPLGAPGTPIPVTASRVLSASENLDILPNAVAATIGFTDAAVQFFIGYGLSSQPHELFFHDEPISLIVTP
jgi:hypothetical protein